MNAQAAAHAWRRLVEAGIAHGATPSPSTSTGPWYIAAMTGAAAWLAAVFLMFFMGLALEDLLDERAGALLVGAALCIASIIVLRRAGIPIFVSQLAVAFGLAGQALIGAGLLIDGGYRTAYAWLIFAACETALIVLVEHAAHRVLATLAAAFALRMAMFTVSLETLFLPLLLAAFVFAQSRVLAADRRFALWRTVAIGLSLAMLAALVADAIIAEFFRPESASLAFAQTLLVAKRVALPTICAAAAYCVARDAGADAKSPTTLVAMLLAAAVALAAYPIPGVAAAIVVLLMAFAVGQPALVGLAIVMLVAALAHYYYRLDATLLVKSAALAGTGVILLAARAAMRRLLPEAEARHA